MALLSIALHDLRVPAISFTGSQSGIITDESHASARILEVRPVRVREELARGKVVIVAGFQGVSQGKEITTLGRGGSDTTAVALAAALGADCEIYSDVDGVYTADPRVVAAPRRLDEISYQEMQELAEAGARVLNAQAVEFARKTGIAIRVRATFGSAAETVVHGRAARGRIAGVTWQSGLALLRLPAAGLPAAREVLSRHGAEAAEVARDGGRVTLALSLDNVHGWSAASEELARLLRASLAIEDQEMASVSVVGTAAGESDRVRREVERVLAELGEPPRAVFASPLRVTGYGPAGAMPEAVRRLHARLVDGTS